MKIIPYIFPLVPEYRSNRFKKQTLHYKSKLEKVFFENPRFAKKLQDYWTYYIPIKPPKNKKRGWMPKLYICVGATAYWSTVLKLIKKYKKSKIHWKFYMAPSGYERPDKIIMYFKSGLELTKTIKKLRPLLPKKGFHTLSHTASTAEMGLESRNLQGLYVGIDPPFRDSWRMYRSMCIAWANSNNEYLDRLKGGKKLWYKRMNLSLKHAGPHSLSPSVKNHAYIKKYWRMIND